MANLEEVAKTVQDNRVDRRGLTVVITGATR